MDGFPIFDTLDVFAKVAVILWQYDQTFFLFQMTK